MSTKVTVNLDPALHREIQLRSAETSRSVCDFINEAIREALAQDTADLRTFDERTGESVLEFEDFVKTLKHNGTL